MVPLLGITGLTKLFGGLRAVGDFHLALGQGELVGLIGPNGAGKTTVFNLITGLVPPTAGRIVFDGADLAGLAPSSIARRGIARTFQNIRLFKEATVLDNVRIPLHPKAGYGLIDACLRGRRFAAGERAVTERAVEVLSILGLGDKLAEKASSLPYGAQRRLEIARALAAGPKLLLLDEPAAGMNPAEVGRLVELIREVKERFDLTVLLIEHQMGVVMNLCERIVVMDFGEIIAEGGPAEIQRNERVLEAYLGRTEVSR
jgi:branched-chain amino acid transport system ATP-binding protein